jgi:hypothetical protein
MGVPRFTPARLFASPRAFGRSPTARPHYPSPLSPIEAAWAWYQHRTCLAVYAELGDRDQTVADFARGLGADLIWLTRKLHGQAPASLGDLLEWSLYLRVQVLPIVTSPAELLPPRVR